MEAAEPEDSAFEVGRVAFGHRIAAVDHDEIGYLLTFEDGSCMRAIPTDDAGNFAVRWG